MHANDFQINLSSSSATLSRSSLLIPEMRMGYFGNQCKQHEGLLHYFSHLLRCYLSRPEYYNIRIRRQMDSKWKKTYQKSGQNFKKRSFTPDAVEWECFRNASCVAGVSMCFLFVLLMEFEMDGLLKYHPKKPIKKSPLARNSLPEESDFSELFIKFSIFEQRVDILSVKLRRKYKQS